MSRNGAPARSPEEIDRALIAVIGLGGNCQRASHLLKDSGMEYPPSVRSLQLWKVQHAARYEQLQEDYAPMVAQKVAAAAEELALRIGEAEDVVVTKMLADVDKIEPRDLSRALRDLSTSKALQFDKLSNPLRGRPSTITETRDASDVLRRIGAKVPNLIVDVESTELPPLMLPSEFNRGE